MIQVILHHSYWKGILVGYKKGFMEGIDMSFLQLEKQVDYLNKNILAWVQKLDFCPTAEVIQIGKNHSYAKGLLEGYTKGYLHGMEENKQKLTESMELIKNNIQSIEKAINNEKEKLGINQFTKTKETGKETSNR